MLMYANAVQPVVCTLEGLRGAAQLALVLLVTRVAETNVQRHEHAPVSHVQMHSLRGKHRNR